MVLLCGCSKVLQGPANGSGAFLVLQCIGKRVCLCSQQILDTFRGEDVIINSEIGRAYKKTVHRETWIKFNTSKNRQIIYSLPKSRK